MADAPDVNALITARIRELVALKLWAAGAIRANNAEPFKLASGNFSPIYVNCRQVISDPAFMMLFNAAVVQICRDEGIHAGVIAGGETAGIPFAAYVAQALSLPLVYVRKAAKGYGIASLVEGGSVAGKTVLLVEDLITDAGSKKHFIDALGAAGAKVSDVLVLFDRRQGGAEALAAMGIILHSATDLRTALNAAMTHSLMPPQDLKSIDEYLANPKEWHARRNLPFTE